VLVIGGTGSSVMGRCDDGMRFTCGGWGPGVADEGSGFWLGREAVRQGFRALDRGIETGLVEAVRLAWGAADAGAVVGLANALPGPDFAALVPAVVACAAAGDVVAQTLLRRAGEELAEQVGVVAARMRACGAAVGGVAYTGSILEKVGPVREALGKALPSGLWLMDGAVNSMDGAMWRARRGTADRLART
jgi:glucosamine kinase